MTESMQSAADKFRAASAAFDRLAAEHPGLPLSYAAVDREGLVIHIHGDGSLDWLAEWSRAIGAQATKGYDYVSSGDDITSHSITTELDGVALEVTAYVNHGPAAEAGGSE